MNDLSTEQKVEKAIQHVISYAGYISRQELGEGADTAEILALAAARVWKCKLMKQGTPDAWKEHDFAQYLRECMMEA